MVDHQMKLGNEQAPSLDGEAARLLRLIKKHTSLEEEQLKGLAPSVLDDPSTFGAYFTKLKTDGWIETGGAGWRMTKQGAIWLDMLGDSVSTEEEELGVDDQPKKPYDVAKLKVEPRNLSIFQALRKIERNEIILNPDFQRAFVWDEVRQSRLIESILIRIPLPAFYLDATDLVSWNVVDGLQRLSTLYRYCRGSSFPLRGLEFLTELDGLRFSELPHKYQVLIEDDTQLIFNNLLPGTPIKAKFTIFSRVNTGGLTLTAQEIRHALNQGPITRALKKIASSAQFLDATGHAVDPRRMADHELILRALSFLHFGWKGYSEFTELDKYLVDTMKQFNSDLDEKELDGLSAKFLQCLGKVRRIFGDYAFRKFYERGGRRGPLNKALFEAWTVNVSNFDDAILVKRSDQIIDSFLDLMNNDRVFINSITYGTGKYLSVKRRFETIETLLHKACQ